MKVSVLIITKDRPTSLARTVQSLLTGSTKPKEIIVIDSSRDNSSKQILLKLSYRISMPIIYRKIKSRGINYSLNKGIKLCRSEIIAKIDDDEYAHHDWIKTIIQIFSQHPSLAATTGPVYPTKPENYWNRIWQEIFTESYTFSGPTPFVYGSNAAYKREIFTKAHFYFDERIRSFASEDTYISQKIINAGLQIYHDHKIIVFHDFRTSCFSFLKQWTNYGISDSQLFRYYPSLYKNTQTSHGGFLAIISITARKAVYWKNVSRKIELIPGLLLRTLAYLFGVCYGILTKRHHL